MFGTLTEKLQGLVSRFSKTQKFTEENISGALEEVRLALLDADVNYDVAASFLQRVKEKVLGRQVLKSVDVGHQWMKAVHDELVALMGTEEATWNLKGKPAIVMLCGLQGSGKTTTCAKLAAYIRKLEPNKKILMAACDLQRPAAIEQLKTLGASMNVPVFSVDGAQDPIQVVKKAKEEAISGKYDVLLVDTAGRLHLDQELMDQLFKMQTLLQPQEVLFVASAMMGQDAVRTAAEFDKKVAITGSILTMLDGNARAGAAISIREVTKKPLKFEGVGEKIGDLQKFHPHSMADRILGMGDIINLVRKAEETFDEEEKKKMEQKLRTASFTYDDYLQQMGMLKQMGSMKGLLKMMPGLSGLGDLDLSDKKFRQMEAMICSMTPRERSEKDELTHHRRKRIAKGSALLLEEVNRMVNSFNQMKLMFKNMSKMQKNFPQMGNLQNLKNQLKGNQWR
jgi:signal recognition particle subunit SRP54